MKVFRWGIRWITLTCLLGVAAIASAQDPPADDEPRGSRQWIWQTVANATEAIAANERTWPGQALGSAGNAITAAVVETVLLDEGILPVYQFVGETARTDKQIGSTSTSRGTTSLLEKPGIPTLLALAIERGAIEQESSGTDVTLRSTPASIFKALYRGEGHQRAEDAAAYEWLRRVGASITAPIDDTDSSAQGNPDLKEITEWSIQLDLNFWGDRTVYSQTFVDKWNETVAPAIVKRLENTNALITIVGDEPLFSTPALQADLRNAMQSSVDVNVTVAADGTTTLVGDDAVHLQELAASANLPEDLRRLVRDDPVAKKLYDAIDGFIEARVRTPIRNDPSLVPDSVRAQIEEIVPELISSEITIKQIKEDLRKDFEDVLAVPAFTAEYTNHNPGPGAAFSDAKLLLQHKIDLTSLVLVPEPFDLIWNANVSFYHHPDMGQEDVRDFGVGLGAEFAFDNPFPRFLSDADLSSITLSFSGRVARMESEKDEAAFGQAKLEIPIAAAFKIPISVTYASRTEDNEEDEVRGNFGVSFDFDQLYALAGLALMRR